MNLRPRLALSLSGLLILAAAWVPAAFSQPLTGIQAEWAALADQPASHTGFIFDRSMMQVAQAVLESGGMSPERAAAALTGISVDNYRYAEPAFYTPEAMSALVASYRAAGWKHLVNANQSPAESAQPRGIITDLWLHNSGADINGLVVLTRSSRDMSVVQVACELRPLDLIHLSGHFGIPKVDPNAVMVPAPDGR
jgi:hypothetical protein